LCHVIFFFTWSAQSISANSCLFAHKTSLVNVLCICHVPARVMYSIKELLKSYLREFWAGQCPRKHQKKLNASTKSCFWKINYQNYQPQLDLKKCSFVCAEPWTITSIIIIHVIQIRY
jgi:hypothetical protein